jgi:hypothetical protein
VILVLRHVSIPRPGSEKPPPKGRLVGARRQVDVR